MFLSHYEEFLDPYNSVAIDNAESLDKPNQYNLPNLSNPSNPYPCLPPILLILLIHIQSTWPVHANSRILKLPIESFPRPLVNTCVLVPTAPLCARVFAPSSFLLHSPCILALSPIFTLPLSHPRPLPAYRDSFSLSHRGPLLPRISFCSHCISC